MEGPGTHVIIESGDTGVDLIACIGLADAVCGNRPAGAVMVVPVAPVIGNLISDQALIPRSKGFVKGRDRCVIRAGHILNGRGIIGIGAAGGIQPHHGKPHVEAGAVMGPHVDPVLNVAPAVHGNGLARGFRV